MKAICEPLQSCSPTAEAHEIQEELRKRDFDVVGVRSAEDGPVLGLVQRSDLLDGRVGAYVQLIPDSHLIDAENSVRSLLKKLKEFPHIFVRCQENITHIVTRADLNKPIVRAYWFGLISLFEIHLGFWIKEHYQNDSWENFVPDGRLNKARGHRDALHSKGHKITLLECLQLCDKKELVAGNAVLRGIFGFASRKQAICFLERTESLRNQLAHSQYDLTCGTSWDALFKVLEVVDAALSRSDEAVEKSYSASAEKFMTALWTYSGAASL